MSTQAEEDIAAITPTPMAQIGGGGLMVAGLFTLVLAAQTATMLLLRGLVLLILAAMFSLGAAAVVLGWKVTRMRGWAALAGAIVSAVLCVSALAWLVFSFLNGVFSLLAIGIVPLSGLACALSGLCIDRCQKADVARARLKEDGLDVGS